LTPRVSLSPLPHAAAAAARATPCRAVPCGLADPSSQALRVGGKAEEEEEEEGCRCR